MFGDFLYFNSPISVVSSSRVWKFRTYGVIVSRLFVGFTRIRNSSIKISRYVQLGVIIERKKFHVTIVKSRPRDVDTTSYCTRRREAKKKSPL